MADYDSGDESVLEREVKKERGNGGYATREINFGGGGGGGDDSDRPPRAFTDVFCLLVFLAFLGGMGYIYEYSQVHGNIKKITHGFDWAGRICGVDYDNDPEQGNATVLGEYLFWCANANGELTQPDGICVPYCPTGREGETTSCPDNLIPFVEDMKTDADGNSEQTVGFTRKFVQRQTYPTDPMGTAYCLPVGTDDKAKKIFEEILDKSPWGGSAHKVLSFFTSIENKRYMLLGVAIAAVVTGYSFLLLMKIVIEPFVYGLIAGVWIMLFGATVYFGYTSVGENPDNPFYYFTEQDDVAKKYDLIACGVMVLLTGLYTFVVFNSSEAIQVTVQSVQEATEVLWAMPTLLLQPLVQVLLHLFNLIVVGYGLLWVVSIGSVQTNVSFNPYNPASFAMTKEISGLNRSFSWTQEQYYMIFYFLFGLVWIKEIITAWGSFAISHAVVVYKWTEESQYLPLSRGYKNGLLYHLGSLAFGAFIIGVLKVLTAILSYLAKQFKSDSQDPVNMASKALLYCCTCCLGCFTKIMELVNEMVYVEIAISGRSYCGASSKVWKRMLTNSIVFATISGITNVVKVLGVVLVGGGGTYVTYLILSDSTVSSTAREYSPAVANALESEDAFGATVAAGIIWISIATVFMQVFDRAADSLCYFILYKKSKDSSYPSPESWQMVNADAGEQMVDS